MNKLQLLLIGFSALLTCFVNCTQFSFPAKNSPGISHTPLEHLGRNLFFDTRLSATGTKSCASCHDPKFAFSDGYRRSSGIYADPTLRNAPSLINSVFMPSLNWANPDIKTFPQQVLRPLFNDNPPEMGLQQTEQQFNATRMPHAVRDAQGMPIDSVFNRLKKDTLYIRLVKAAFPGINNPWTTQRLTEALEAYEKTLISLNSPYDAWLNGNKNAITENARRGKDLFFSNKLGCSACHNGQLLSDGQLYNIGLYALDAEGNYPAEDQGLYGYSLQPGDKGRFRTPSLRNIALTAPYFHDGSVDLLTDAIAVFEKGGRVTPQGGDGRANPHKSAKIKPFQLTTQERLDLIAFLDCLTDTTIQQNDWFQNPFNN